MTDTPIRKRHWEARELVLIGVFAAAAKLSSLLIALAGGGMNPVSLLLFTVISMIVSVCLMGGSLTLLPAALVGALLGELCILLTGGAFKPWSPWVGVGVYDLVSKGLSLGVSFLFMRESPSLMTMVVPIVFIGYLGSLGGLWFGCKTVKELRHAGFVR